MTSKARRNAVVLAVVTLVGSAMYLNWSYVDAQEVGQKILGEATLVQNAQDTPPAEEVLAEASDGDYFAEARLNRQQARDQAIALLEKASGAETADSELLSAAAESIQTLAAYSVAEAQVENLITAKGYADCVAFMGDGSISIVVEAGEEGLQTADVAKITDVVLSETSYQAHQIRILEAN